MKKTILALTVLLTVVTACAPEPDLVLSAPERLAFTLEAVGGKEQFILPESDDFASIPQDPNNPLTTAKVRLGQLLFHETGIGTEAVTEGNLLTYSCASCHFAGAGFQAGRFQGIGEGGEGFGLNGERREPLAGLTAQDLDVQPIRTPAALNVAYQEVMLWNGQFGATGPNEGTEDAWTPNTPKAENWLGFQGVETQALAGLGVHRLMVNADIVDSLGYKPLFDAAFPDLPPSQRYEKLPAALAIAAFERTVLANRAPFQRYLRGERNALTLAEQEGAILFFGKAGCVSCHSGPSLAGMEFHALGMADLVDCPEPTFRTDIDNAENLGRGGFTGQPEDHFKFKVPQLYSLKRTPFYGHGASFRSLRDVVDYKNTARPENPRLDTNQLPPGFRPLLMTEAEIDALTDFLEDALNDGDLRRYEPESLPSGQCFPNHDERSRLELGCR